MKSKILPELTEEDAIELAEAATNQVGNWYYAGMDNKGKPDQCMVLSTLDGEENFIIYTHKRMFQYICLETDWSMKYYAIELVDKLRELGYELV